MSHYKIPDLPISAGLPPAPDEAVAIWNGHELRRWVDVGEWERLIRTQERQRCKQAVRGMCKVAKSYMAGLTYDEVPQALDDNVISAIDALGEK